MNILHENHITFNQQQILISKTCSSKSFKDGDILMLENLRCVSCLYGWEITLAIIPDTQVQAELSILARIQNFICLNFSAYCD